MLFGQQHFENHLVDHLALVTGNQAQKCKLPRGIGTLQALLIVTSSTCLGGYVEVFSSQARSLTTGYKKKP